MENEIKTKHLIEIIKRYDTYVNSCNAKAAIILSYCMACIAGISFKTIDIFSKYCHEKSLIYIILAITFVVTIFFTLKSSKIAYEAIYPKLNNGNSSHEKKSMIFFRDVATINGGREAYIKFWEDLNSKDLLNDYSKQVFIMAKITNEKFSTLSECISIIKNKQIPSIFFSLFILALSSALTK